MRAPRSAPAAAAVALLASACGAPGFRLAQPVDPWTLVEPVEPESGGGAPAPGRVRFKRSVCEGIDLRPEAGPLDETSLVTFLRAHGTEVRTERARSDLIYVELRAAGTLAPIRLRVAVLADADAAGIELHRALREHGAGAFGVHRGNLAVLGPAGRFADVLALAGRTRLPCWGVLTVSGDESAFVVGGGYAEP